MCDRCSPSRKLSANRTRTWTAPAAAVHGCPQVPAEMQMPRRRALGRDVRSRQIAVARLDRTRELLTLPRIAVEDERAVAGGRACPLDQGMLPRRRRRRAPGPHAVLRAFARRGDGDARPAGHRPAIRWARTGSGWCRSGVLGFCCSRIGLGALNTQAAFTTLSPRFQRGLFLVRTADLYHAGPGPSGHESTPLVLERSSQCRKTAKTAARLSSRCFRESLTVMTSP